MKNLRGILVLWLLCSVFPCHAQEGEPARVDRTRGMGDVVCGPRCVQYVLQHYGRDEDLTDLIREVQWPDIEGGASLDSLNEALQERGVFTKAIRIPASGRLSWRHPVVVHLGNTSESIGHYVVWLPSSTHAQADVWTGLAGVQSGPASGIYGGSPVVLLTAPTPITTVEGVVDTRSVLFRRLRLVVSVTCACVFVVLLCRWYA